MTQPTEDRPISISIEEWEARKAEDRPLPPGYTQQSIFDGPTA